MSNPFEVDFVIGRRNHKMHLLKLTIISIDDKPDSAIYCKTIVCVRESAYATDKYVQRFDRGIALAGGTSPLDRRTEKRYRETSVALNLYL